MLSISSPVPVDRGSRRLASPSRWLLALFSLALLLLGTPAVRAADDFLEPEKAFVLSATADDERSVELRFDIHPGYYMYREHFRFEAAGGTLGEPVLPAGKVKYDETFQKDVETYRGALSIRLPVSAASGPIRISVTSQGCADAGLCYPPMTSVVEASLRGFGGDGQVRVRTGEDALASPGHSPPGAVDATAAAAQSSSAGGAEPDASSARPDAIPSGASIGLQGLATDSGAINRVLQGGSWWTVIGAFALMGLLLSFTPCVLPMLPILSSIIAGGGPVSRRRGLMLAAVYALGMSLVYTALGIAAGLAGEGLAGGLQQPWVLALFALLLAGFSLAMFDVFELRLPVALATRLDGASRSLPGGRMIGVFLMGGLSAAIVSPCVTAPLAGALVFLGQTGDVKLAGSALFAMAWGMSVPLLLLGASAGTWLPRSGAWMHAVKRFFGLLLLAVALWIVQPVVPPALALALWGALLLVAGFMLRPFDPNPHSGAPRVWLQRAAGVASLAFGVMQLAAAASGGGDPLQPLRHFVLASANTPTASAVLSFQSVNSVQDLDRALVGASGPVMLDFYADWCVSCKEMERFTFSDKAVQQRLSSALLLKADVTANTPAQRELLKRFRLFGPPATIFFDRSGLELDGVRVIGFQSARDFAKTLTAAGL
jgi:thioredoxin:protein disulfide reductase